jgi:hypothetical protein
MSLTKEWLIPLAGTLIRNNAEGPSNIQPDNQSGENQGSHALLIPGETGAIINYKESLPRVNRLRTT